MDTDKKMACDTNPTPPPPPRPGLDVLPTSLTALDLSHSDVMLKNLQALGRLTALQRLNLASTAITVSSLQVPLSGHFNSSSS